MIFQHFALMHRKNVFENAAMPMIVHGFNKDEIKKRVMELLDLVGLADKAKAYPAELSGGQKQRVAIARAMANHPAMILADEPTGALDSETGRQVMDLFHRLHDEEGKTIVLITHSRTLAEECGRIVTIKDGNIIDERRGSLAHG